MKKLITYGSPKQYKDKRNIISDLQDRETPLFETLIVDGKPTEVLPEPSTKKRTHNAKFCKFLKGKHQYGSWEVQRFGWSKEDITGFWVRFCKGCHRQDTWVAPNVENTNYWKLDKDKRPPGFIQA